MPKERTTEKEEATPTEAPPPAPPMFSTIGLAFLFVVLAAETGVAVWIGRWWVDTAGGGVAPTRREGAVSINLGKVKVVHPGRRTPYPFEVDVVLDVNPQVENPAGAMALLAGRRDELEAAIKQLLLSKGEKLEDAATLKRLPFEVRGIINEATAGETGGIDLISEVHLKRDE